MALLATALPPPPPAFNGVAFSVSDKNYCYLTTIKRSSYAEKRAKSFIGKIAEYQRGVGDHGIIRPMMKGVMGQQNSYKLLIILCIQM